MTKTRTLAVAATAATLAVGVAGPAAADPPASRGDSITLTCDALGEVDMVSPPGGGQWTPGLVSGSTRVLTPYSFDIVGTFTPAGGGDSETFEEHAAKNAPHNGRLDTCTFSESGSDEDGSFAIEGTVKLSYTP
jgi:hypothetical protein